MALINALMRLKDDRLVKSFEFVNFTKEKAKVILFDGREVVVYMADDFYILTYVGIKEAWSYPPTPNYIVYNQWDYVTDAAFEAVKSVGATLISFGQFRKILQDAAMNER